MMSGEYWDGWFDHWGEKHQTTNAGQQSQELDWILTQGYSINLYMFHGGTSFGFMNGANWDHTNYEPDVTSYDYDSPVSESGGLTQKYFAFREVIAKYRPGVQIPDPPAPLPMIEVPEFQLTESAPLWKNLPKPVVADHPRSMENISQAYGYILYRTNIKQPETGELEIHELRSYARIFVNGKPNGTLDRRKKQSHLRIAAEAVRRSTSWSKALAASTSPPSCAKSARDSTVQLGWRGRSYRIDKSSRSRWTTPRSCNSRT